MKFSVIIPTYNAELHLYKCIRSIKIAGLHHEIIVVDGGSQDRTKQIALQEKVIFLQAEKGRGVQLRKGSDYATGEILIFLHVDTLLPRTTKSVLIKYFDGYHADIGLFRMKFDNHHWALKLYGFFTRYDSVWTSFGDQCIVCRNSFYKAIGGFPSWSLFEDVFFLQKARQSVKVHIFPVAVITSSEKFLRNGIFKQQLRNGLLIVQYLFGANPQTLSQKYGS